MKTSIIGVVALAFGLVFLAGCKDQSRDALDSSSAIADIDDNSKIAVAICCDLFSQKNPCGYFSKAWNLDKGGAFTEKYDLSYEEALSYAAFIDRNVRTEGIGAWNASLGEIPPDNGSSGEFPQGQKLERLIYLRKLAYNKLGIIQINEYFLSLELLIPLFASDPNDAYARKDSIESDYRDASCKFLHALYAP